jgi:glycosyltransferase involved in cell wall biosynthesis
MASFAVSTEALRILFVYYEPSQSGQTTHVLSLVKGLDHHRFDLTVVLPDHLTEAIDMFRQERIRVCPLSMRKVIWKPSAILKFFYLIQKGRFDIVHVHSQEAGLISRVLAKFAGNKHTIYTPQTIDIRQNKWYWLYTFLECKLSIVTEKIISVNEIDRNRLVNWGIPPEKVVTIPNGIDLSQFVETINIPDIKLRLDVDSACPLVMQVGRLSPQKNPLAFIEGASIVLKEHPYAQFILIGNGPLRDDVFASIRELGLETRVHVAGWHENAFLLIPAANVITLTSLWEGTPYSLLEAMAWSKPVVATGVSGCSEAVENDVTGFLVNPGDTNSWATCVIELLNNPELAEKLGKHGRKRVESKFCRKEMIERIEHLYYQTVEQ